MPADYNICLGTAGWGVWHSPDSGKSWTRHRKPFPLNSRIQALVVHPTDAETIFAAGGTGVFRSTDGGAAWERLGAQGDLPTVWSLAIDPVDPRVLFAGTRPTGVYRSRDGGVSWEKLAIDAAQECSIGTAFVTSVMVDPDDHRIVWAGVAIDGVYRSLDGGDTWTHTEKGLFDPDIHAMTIARTTPKRVIASTYREMFWSVDAGETWTAVGIIPEVGLLSNIKENGRYIGLADAGQDWHTDMSYRDVMGFVNVLYGVTIPRRDGTVLGGTEFSNMHAAYDGLPDDVKVRLRDATALHDFEKFWEHMRRDKASTRPPLTDEQRRRRPPVTHPLLMDHPITGRKVLYANPGYTIRINELSERESDEMLDVLFAHQLPAKYRFTHTWRERDVLLWDHFGTIHRAIADYGPDEYRLMKRCQVMATKILDPEFVRGALGANVPA